MTPELAAQLAGLLDDYVSAKLPQAGEFSPIEAERKDMKAAAVSAKVCDLLVRVR